MAGRTHHHHAEPVAHACHESDHAGHPVAPAATAAGATAGEVAEWTCPMHPEIRRSAPGTCPLCGMALEPLTATADTGPNPELLDMRRRFWIGLAFALPLFLLDMGSELSGRALLPMPLANWVQLALATPVVLWAGWPLLLRGWQSLLHRSLNMFTLIGLGVAASFLFSLVATMAPGIFPHGF